MFNRILVPLDGSKRAEQALPVAAQVSRSAHGSLLLVEIVSPVVSAGAEFVSPLDMIRLQLQAAREYLLDLKKREDLKDVLVSTKVIEGAAIADDILDIATKERCDLMVLCSHGRTGLLRWALGSVALKLVHHSAIPTLILRSGGQQLVPLEGEAGRTLQVLVPLDESPLA